MYVCIIGLKNNLDTKKIKPSPPLQILAPLTKNAQTTQKKRKPQRARKKE